MQVYMEDACIDLEGYMWRVSSLFSDADELFGKLAHKFYKCERDSWHNTIFSSRPVKR